METIIYMGLNFVRKCGDRVVKCAICVRGPKVENHKCGITGCITNLGWIWTYITSKFANCGENHQPTAFRCPIILKAEIKAWKKRLKNLKPKTNSQSINSLLKNNQL